jgi:transforming growth factor-beta-induced protein
MTSTTERLPGRWWLLPLTTLAGPIQHESDFRRPESQFVKNFTQMADIVATAVAAGSFKTLVAAVTAAGLVETLQSPGPFTVFAPTDEAFAKLPAGTVETLLEPGNKEKLVAILTYHVVPAKVMAADVVGLKEAPTVNGQKITVDTSDAANVVQTDIVCDNGVIHVIDAVILPS